MDVMKIFEVEFVYDDYDKREANGVGSRKNPYRVRIPFPKDELYATTYWSDNHDIIRRIWEEKFNPLIDPDNSSYERKYWINAIRRVR
tara:strand:- start:115 stop:378 length:264 start_codon:yes stop_codon:yes gene_type:complete